jgi:hypothetical protein
LSSFSHPWPLPSFTGMGSSSYWPLPSFTGMESSSYRLSSFTAGLSELKLCGYSFSFYLSSAFGRTPLLSFRISDDWGRQLEDLLAFLVFVVLLTSRGPSSSLSSHGYIKCFALGLDSASVPFLGRQIFFNFHLALDCLLSSQLSGSVFVFGSAGAFASIRTFW